jgi:hypothetical protein
MVMTRRWHDTLLAPHSRLDFEICWLLVSAAWVRSFKHVAGEEADNRP